MLAGGPALLVLPVDVLVETLRACDMAVVGRVRVADQADSGSVLEGVGRWSGRETDEIERLAELWAVLVLVLVMRSRL